MQQSMETIFHGFNPSWEHVHLQPAKYWELRQRTDEKEKAFLSKLSDELREEYTEVMISRGGELEQETTQAYVNGFKTAIRLMIEGPDSD